MERRWLQGTNVFPRLTAPSLRAGARRDHTPARPFQLAREAAAAGEQQPAAPLPDWLQESLLPGVRVGRGYLCLASPSYAVM